MARARSDGCGVRLVLLEDRAGNWVIANAALCSGGKPVKTIPTKLAPVCKVP